MPGIVMRRPLLAGAALLLTRCAEPPGGQAAAPAVPAPVPFEQAVLNAGNAVLAFAASAGAGPAMVIDPLVNGVTGEQSAGTRAIGLKLADLVRQRYPQLQVQPFTATAVAGAPLVMVGTFTPVNAQNQPTGPREAYRFCLVLADLKSGKVIAKKVVRATPDGVDTTPVRAFRDSPAWAADPNVKGYTDTCQATKVGDPIPQGYLDGIVTAAILSQAVDAYDAGRYREALQLYENARATPAGDQLRVHNGLYLAFSKLNQREAAANAFGDLVDYGLRRNSLAVKLLFRPASTAFVADPQVSGAYDMWLNQIAAHTARAGACLQVVGHTSASGSPALNERLSVLRAEVVKTRLEQTGQPIRGRMVASGQGGQQPLVGTGADNASDALDRRVEFRTVPAC